MQAEHPAKSAERTERPLAEADAIDRIAVPLQPFVVSAQDAWRNKLASLRFDVAVQPISFGENKTQLKAGRWISHPHRPLGIGPVRLEASHLALAVRPS